MKQYKHLVIEKKVAEEFRKSAKRNKMENATQTLFMRHLLWLDDNYKRNLRESINESFHP